MNEKFDIEKFFTPIIAMIVIGFVFFLFGKIIDGKIGENRDIALYVLGVLSGVLTMVVGYYFGSSNSSAKKNEIIGNMSKPTSNGGSK